MLEVGQSDSEDEENYKNDEMKFSAVNSIL